MSDNTVTMSLRELSDDEFIERYCCDRFTASVLGNRMRYITMHMATNLLRQAFSPIIAYAYDFATAIVAPPSMNYALPAVNNGLALFTGTLSDAVRNVIEEYGPDRLQEGDVLICNDPSRVGNHVNDMMFLIPVFDEGELVGFVVLRAHQLDMGGMVPGGFGAKCNIYEDGLILGPQLLYSAGEPVKATFSLIFDNARMGQLLLPDLKTIRQSCALGATLLAESIARYGRDAVLGSMRLAVDTSAEAMADGLARIPDGDYVGRSLIDADNAGDDEEFHVVVRVIKRGDRAEVDFSGSSRQARSCINSGVLDAKNAAGVGLSMMLGVTAPLTSGTFRPIDVVIPPGSIASDLPPEGGVFFYYEVVEAVLTALIVALRDVLGDSAIGGDFGSTMTHNANGTNPDGTPWMTMAECGGELGPWGGTRAGDGDGYNAQMLVNMLTVSAEGIESNVPAMVMRKEYIPDTAGPGANRGGSAYLKDVVYRQDATHYSVPLRVKESSGVGVNGGGDGRLGGVWIFDQDGTERRDFISKGTEAYADSLPVAGMLDTDTHAPDPDGEFVYFGRVPRWQTKPGATFRYRTCGGGGWGSPFDRDPARVLRDVRDGYVTVDGARRDYGVIVVGDPDFDPEALSVDRSGTEALRAQA